MSSLPSTITSLDVSKDVATLLREGTAKAHTETEGVNAAVWLTRGRLDKLEYTRFLMMLWQVYTALEESLEHHSSNPVLAPTYNPTVLARSAALSSDIAHLLSVPESLWQQHPLARSLFTNTPQPLSEYTTRIRGTAASELPSLLLAHTYVRYLGDLSGGQVIRRNIIKAYGLDNETGLGTQFYEFQKLGGGGSAGLGDMRKIKQWYRDGMNEGVGNQDKLKVAMVEEANVAFRLNAGLFNLLESPPSLFAEEKSEKQTNNTNPIPSSSGLSFGRIIFFIAAIVLAHYASQHYHTGFVKQQIAHVTDSAIKAPKA